MTLLQDKDSINDIINDLEPFNIINSANIYDKSGEVKNSILDQIAHRRFFVINSNEWIEIDRIIDVVVSDELIPLRFEKNMTQDMLDARLTYREICTDYVYSKRNLMRVRKASNIDLPATAANGKSVLHGARKDMKVIANYWEHRMNLSKRMLV